MLVDLFSNSSETFFRLANFEISISVGGELVAKSLATTGRMKEEG